jgi:hypothetical protein
MIALAYAGLVVLAACDAVLGDIYDADAGGGSRMCGSSNCDGTTGNADGTKHGGGTGSGTGGSVGSGSQSCLGIGKQTSNKEQCCTGIVLGQRCAACIFAPNSDMGAEANCCSKSAVSGFCVEPAGSSGTGTGEPDDGGAGGGGDTGTTLDAGSGTGSGMGTGPGMGTGSGTGTGPPGMGTGTGTGHGTGPGTGTGIGTIGDDGGGSGTGSGPGFGDGGGSKDDVPWMCDQADGNIGCCDGNLSYYCEGEGGTGTLTMTSCSAGDVCGWSTSELGYRCVPSPAPVPPDGTPSSECQ